MFGETGSDTAATQEVKPSEQTVQQQPQTVTGQQAATTPDTAGQQTTPTEQTQQQPEQTVKDVAQATGLNVDELSNVWSEKGELPAEAYDKLKEIGLNKDTVDNFCKSMDYQRTAQITEFRNDVATHVGGKDNLNALINFFNSEDFPVEKRDDINSMINPQNVTQAKMALSEVQKMFEQKYGSSGNLISGEHSTESDGDVFKSRSDQGKAFIEARNSGDKSRMKQVREKAGRTSRHNRKHGINW